MYIYPTLDKKSSNTDIENWTEIEGMTDRKYLLFGARSSKRKISSFFKFRKK